MRIGAIRIIYDGKASLDGRGLVPLVLSSQSIFDKGRPVWSKDTIALVEDVVDAERYSGTCTILQEEGNCYFYEKMPDIVERELLESINERDDDCFL